MQSVKAIPESLVRVGDLLVTLGGAISATVVVIMAAMITVGVTMRYLFNRPAPFVEEYTGYMLVLITLVGAGYTLRKRGHISVDIVVRMLPPRMVPWLTVFTDLASLLCVVTLIILTTRLVSMSFARGTLATTIMETPIGAVQLLMPIGLTLLGIELTRAVYKSIKSTHLRPPR